MLRLWALLGKSKKVRPQSKAQTPTLTPLEPRQLLIVGPMKSMIVPQILKPTGHYVPVVLSGSLPIQLAAHGPVASFRVVDEYRQVEPGKRINLVATKILDAKKHTYQFEFSQTFYLKASRSKAIPDGRHYYVTLVIGDSDNVQTKTIDVIVPK